MSELALGLSISALFCAGVTVVFSILSYAKVVGMEKSTHRIQQQYVPLDMEHMGPTGEELVKKMNKAFYPEEEGHV